MGNSTVSKTQQISEASLRVGSIVSVTFPFSNLKGQKVRPALVLANVEFNNLVLCQITSKPYTSKIAIRINPKDFARGSLPIISFVRPDKLFTADTSIIKDIVGQLTPTTKGKILKSVRELFI